MSPDTIEMLARWMHETHSAGARLRKVLCEPMDFDALPSVLQENYRSLATAMLKDPPKWLLLAFREIEIPPNDNPDDAKG